MIRTNEYNMKAYQAGDIEAFERLYERMQKPLFSFLFRYTRDEQLSIDIVQDTFERVQLTKDRYDESKGTVKSYLFQIAYRLMINKLNRRKKWQTIFPFLTPIARVRLSIDDTLTIQCAITQLPDKQRAVILLAYYDDLPQNEISQILSIPVGTVKSRLHTAMAALKEALKEEFRDEGRH